MPGAHRLGDGCSGHGCWPPRANVAASPDVIVNGVGSHRVGDGWATHCCTDKPFPCHASIAASGSPNVIVNGRPKCRIGDAVACGSSMATGSSNVIVN